MRADGRLPELRMALADRYAIDRRSITALRSSSVRQSARSSISGYYGAIPDDRVALFTPAFPPCGRQPCTSGFRSYRFPCGTTVSSPERRLIRHWQPKPRAIIIVNNANKPTGALYGPAFA